MGINNIENNVLSNIETISLNAHLAIEHHYAGRFDLFKKCMENIISNAPKTQKVDDELLRIISNK